MKKIKKEARARARLRQQIKVKEEEEEEDLMILEEKILKRNRGRTYLDKSRPEVLQFKSEQKRKADWDLSSQWKKKVRKSSG